MACFSADLFHSRRTCVQLPLLRPSDLSLDLLRVLRIILNTFSFSIQAGFISRSLNDSRFAILRRQPARLKLVEP